MRAEGHTELVGDIIITCTGGDPSQRLLANFQLFLNTNVTSRLLGSGLSEALLMIDEPLTPRLNRAGAVGTPTPLCVSPGFLANPNTPAECNAAAPAETFQTGSYTAFRAQPATAANGASNAAVIWAGVPIVPPGSNNTRSIRITNVRANAAGVPASTSLVPTQIFAFLSISASNSLALNNPQQAVAFVLPGLVFDVRNCAGGSTGLNPSLAQCTSENSSLFSDPSSGGPFGARLGLRFREGFQTAFKRRIEPGQDLSVPGIVYNSESGFVRPETELTGVGIANSATRVTARFTNVPAGTRLFVSVNSVTGATETGSLTGGAVLVSVSDPNGAGSSIGGVPVPISSTTTLNCSVTGSGYTSAAAAEVPLTGGAGIATWEVTAADPSVIDTLFFPVGIAYTANVPNSLPALGQSSVTGSFAPFYAANSTANTASATLPIPRFIDNVTPRNLYLINQCVTNLLFPFVTNQAGFDTGIAISNTSRDPFSGNAGRLQAGNCTINYYGTTPGGPAPSAQTTNAVVDAGSQLLFVLSSGGNLGIAGTPGFQGYIIATCGFQYAHGFAFITDGPIGSARVAEGYLALVMDSGISTRTGASSEVLSH